MAWSRGGGQDVVAGALPPGNLAKSTCRFVGFRIIPETGTLPKVPPTSYEMDYSKMWQA